MEIDMSEANAVTAVTTDRQTQKQIMPAVFSLVRQNLREAMELSKLLGDVGLAPRASCAARSRAQGTLPASGRFQSPTPRRPGYSGKKVRGQNTRSAKWRGARSGSRRATLRQTCSRD